jgi:hypothetical protein
MQWPLTSKLHGSFLKDNNFVDVVVDQTPRTLNYSQLMILFIPQPNHFTIFIFKQTILLLLVVVVVAGGFFWLFYCKPRARMRRSSFKNVFFSVTFQSQQTGRIECSDIFFR